jgi:hypothetical protein
MPRIVLPSANAPFETANGPAGVGAMRPAAKPSGAGATARTALSLIVLVLASNANVVVQTSYSSALVTPPEP